MKRVLVIDDERKMRRVLQMLLENLGVESIAAETGEEGLRHLGDEQVDLVMTDLRLPGIGGVEVLRRIRATDAQVPVIVLTAYGTVENAVEAMRLGAFDFVLKPFDLDAVEATVRKALELQQVRAENRYLREQLASTVNDREVVAESPAMRATFDRVRQVAATSTTVLIAGETGVGKEVVARAIHDLGPRRDKLFVAINCAAIPSELLESELFGYVRGAFTGAQATKEGKFEVAEGGTLFLDEIGDMPQALQAKLLRVLEDSVVERLGSNRRVKIDARIVSSTNRDLEADVRSGAFREDLYYRLNVFHIPVPPLRQRREDVVPLATGFLDRFAREFGNGTLALTPAAGALLERYEWPGNVRELQNLMERAAVLSPGRMQVIGEGDLREFLPGVLPPAASIAASSGAKPDDHRLAPVMDDLERRTILRALHSSGDNKAMAARLLDVSERTLWYKLKKHGL
jgi:two-component system response regulator AtoC